MILLKSLEDIDKITSDFRKAIIQPDGSHEFDEERYEYLGKIHFDIPHMEYNVLCEIPRYLVRTSIFPRGSVYEVKDKFPFLLWMAEVSTNHEWDFEYRDKRFESLFGALISSHLFDVSSINMPNNFRNSLITNFHILQACYAFPFLERCIRFKCHKYVDPDGAVIKDFDIPRRHPYKIGPSPISNISDELKLLYHHVASPNFQNILNRFMNEVNEDTLIRLPNPFNLIGDFRNKLLHGEKLWSSGLNIATYLICLIVLSYISEDEYNSKIDSLLERIQWKQKTNSDFLWYSFQF